MFNAVCGSPEWFPAVVGILAMLGILIVLYLDKGEA